MFVVAARSVKHFWLRDRSRFFAVEAATAASGRSIEFVNVVLL
jgi:hypothetical protein